jgi:hypothetical protein
MKRLWLIDASYVHANNLQLFGGGARVDYLKLRLLVEDRLGPIWRGYYLNSVQNEAHAGRERFHSWLQSAMPNGPQLIARLYGLKSERAGQAFCADCGTKVDLHCPHGAGHTLLNQRQMGVDVGLATLALTQSDAYDTLVLSSGDGDLLDAIEHLIENGKNLELAVFSSGVSTDLQARAERILWLDEHMDALVTGSGRSG